MYVNPSIANDIQSSKYILNLVRYFCCAILGIDLFYIVALGCFMAKNKVSDNDSPKGEKEGTSCSSDGLKEKFVQADA